MSKTGESLNTEHETEKSRLRLEYMMNTRCTALIHDKTLQPDKGQTN